MSIKPLTLQGTLPDGAGTTIVLALTKTKLETIIDSESFMPLNLRLETSNDTDTKISKIVARRKGKPEVGQLVILDLEHPVSIAMVNDMLGPDGNGVPSMMEFPVRHDFELYIEGTGATGGSVVTAVLAVENQGDGDPGQVRPNPRFSFIRKGRFSAVPIGDPPSKGDPQPLGAKGGA